MITLLVTTSLAAVRPIISYRALAIGASATELGIITAGYAVLALFVAVPIGRVVDRVGEMRFILGGALALGVTALVLTMVGSVVGLIVAHSAIGLAQVMTFVGVQALLTSGGDVEAFDGRYGWFAAFTSLGQIAGPAMAGFVAESSAGLNGAFVLGGGLAAGALVLALTLWQWPPPDHRAEEDQHPPAPPGSIRRLLARPGMPQGLFASLSVLASIDILMAYLPAYGERYGISVATVGLLLAVRGTTSLVSRVGMVAMIRRVGRRVLLSSSLFSAAASLAIFPLFGDATVPLFILMAISGVGLGLAQPMTMSWVAATAPVAERATALSARITGNRLGQLTLPAAVGAVAGAGGVSLIFVMLGVVLAASAAALTTTHFTHETDTTGRPREGGPAEPRNR